MQIEQHLSITGAASAEWIPVKPKTDPAFLFGLFAADGNAPAQVVRLVIIAIMTVLAMVVARVRQQQERRLAEAQRVREAGQATVPSSIAAELATNPFLRADEPAVRAAAAARLGAEPATVVDAFAAIREWKNQFR